MQAIDRLLTSSRPFVTDGGLETDLIFHGGFDLPLFSSFVLLDSPEGRAGLAEYFGRYLDLAADRGQGYVLDTPTWRANAGWAPRLGLGEADLRRINREAVRFVKALRDGRPQVGPILVNGCIGPAGDGYAPGQQLSAAEAESLHRPQIEAFAAEGVDLATALTMTHVGEATGAARAARAAGIAVVISFTVETDGHLPVGLPLGEAIARVDEATGGAPLFYGINCAHPTHFVDRLEGDWTGRIGLVRANASRLSHAELDEATELDDGDPADLGRRHVELAERLPGLRIVGGCCGTDHRHVGCMMDHLHA